MIFFLRVAIAVAAAATAMFGSWKVAEKQEWQPFLTLSQYVNVQHYLDAFGLGPAKFSFGLDETDNVG